MKSYLTILWSIVLGSLCSNFYKQGFLTVFLFGLFNYMPDYQPVLLIDRFNICAGASVAALVNLLLLLRTVLFYVR